MVFQIDLGNDRLIADIRRRLEQGHVAATVERIRKIAAHRDDADLLRQLVAVLADTIESPPKRERKRPRKHATYKRTEIRNGEAVTIFDLDAWIPKTDREMRAECGRLALHVAVRYQVETIQARRPRLGITGAILEAARIMKITESEARKAYYDRLSR